MASTFQEVAITCCFNDPVASAYMWDVQTGTSLITYRGDPVTPVGLSLLSGEYVVAALQDKPFLRVWPINSQQSLSSLRLVCPGRVTHAQASPDGCYIAVTVSEKVHFYQISSGRLLGSGARHYQPIKVVQWSPDSSTVVCGGEDGLVTVWALDSVVSSHHIPEPQKVLSDHSLAVTDLKITAGSRPRLLSASIDRTCKIYDLYQGTLLLSLVFDQPLTAVSSAALDTDVFVGTANGSVWQVSLLSPPRHLEFHVSIEDRARQFSGHTKAVQCLSTSLSGELLMSGSSDGFVKIWHIASCQCLKTFTLKGPVTNALFVPKPKQLFDNELKPSIVLNSFQSGNSEVDTFVQVINNEPLALCDNTFQELFPSQTSDSSEERVQSLKTDINLLKSINSNLYKFSINKIISSNNVLTHPAKLKSQSDNNKNQKRLNIKLQKKINKKKALKQKLNNSKKKQNLFTTAKINNDKIICGESVDNSNRYVSPLSINKGVGATIQNNHESKKTTKEVTVKKNHESKKVNIINQTLKLGKQEKQKLLNGQKKSKNKKKAAHLNVNITNSALVVNGNEKKKTEDVNVNITNSTPVVNGGILPKRKKRKRRQNAVN